MVTIAQGKLRGREMTAERGTTFFGFRGIPYAKAPLGKLRFQAPQAPEPWEGVRDAAEDGSDCIHFNMITRQLTGTEDCLFINVYSPRLPSSSAGGDQLLPVMFWVHGGGFTMGSGSQEWYGPEYLLDHEVLLVTFNYRLGALGFLSLDIAGAPGNAGLKDQVAALRWVRENIAAFGGDPGNVTIFGESAGGASVHYLMLSDSSRGLFHKAISQSGSALNPWACQQDAREKSFALCAALGHLTEDPKDALEFLQGVSAVDLATAHNALPTKEQIRRGLTLMMVPCIEKEFPGVIPFLSQSILQRMNGQFHDVPYMTGYLSAEGILELKEFNSNPNFLSEWEKDFERVVPLDMNLPQKSKLSVEISDRMRQFYCGRGTNEGEQLQAYIDLATDKMFLHGIYTTVKLQSAFAKSPIFYYRLSFDKMSLVKPLFGITLPGACHADDLPYLFKMHGMPLASPPGSDVEMTQKRILAMWTNFARTGDPTPAVDELIPVKWQPVQYPTTKQTICLDIGETLSVGVMPELKRMALWDDLYQKIAAAAREPSDTKSSL